MSFEDIKKDWNDDKGENIKLPDALQSLHSLQSPIMRIRKNMKAELWVQLAGIVFISILPQLVGMKPDLVLPYYLMFVLLLALSIYFFTRFYFFYGKMGNMIWDTKDSLYELFYGMKLNIEMYKSFTYMLLPFALIIFFFFNFGPKANPLADAFQLYPYNRLPVYQYFLILLLYLPFVYFLTEYWVKIRYGKYVDEVRDLINELREEKT